MHGHTHGHKHGHTHIRGGGLKGHAEKDVVVEAEIEAEAATWSNELASIRHEYGVMGGGMDVGMGHACGCDCIYGELHATVEAELAEKWLRRVHMLTCTAGVSVGTVAGAGCSDDGLLRKVCSMELHLEQGSKQGNTGINTAANRAAANPSSASGADGAGGSKRQAKQPVPLSLYHPMRALLVSLHQHGQHGQRLAKRESDQTKQQRALVDTDASPGLIAMSAVAVAAVPAARKNSRETDNSSASSGSWSPLSLCSLRLLHRAMVLLPSLQHRALTQKREARVAMLTAAMRTQVK